MSTQVHAVATLLNKCRASRLCRACRDERVAPCCSTNATQHATTFSCAKTHRLDSVSCRDVAQQQQQIMKIVVTIVIVYIAVGSKHKHAV